MSEEEAEWPDCEKHRNEEADFFCVEDDQYFCKICAVLHKHHSIEVLEEMFKTYWTKWNTEKESVNKDFNQGDTKLKNKLASIRNETNEIYEDVMEYVEAACARDLIALDKDLNRL